MTSVHRCHKFKLLSLFLVILTVTLNGWHCKLHSIEYEDNNKLNIVLRPFCIYILLSVIGI